MRLEVSGEFLYAFLSCSAIFASFAPSTCQNLIASRSPSLRSGCLQFRQRNRAFVLAFSSLPLFSSRPQLTNTSPFLIVVSVNHPSTHPHTPPASLLFVCESCRPSHWRLVAVVRAAAVVRKMEVAFMKACQALKEARRTSTTMAAVPANGWPIRWPFNTTSRAGMRCCAAIAIAASLVSAKHRKRLF